MSIIDVIAVAKAVQITGQFGPIVIPDGSTSFRIEPDVDPTDWKNGMMVSLSGFIQSAKKTEPIGAVLSQGFDRNGALLQPYLEINCPLDLTDPKNPLPIPYVGCSVSGAFVTNRQTNIGIRICVAPDSSQLPAALPAPVAIQSQTATVV